MSIRRVQDPVLKQQLKTQRRSNVRTAFKNIGSAAVGGISKVFGFGDYTITSNTLGGGNYDSGGVPQFSNPPGEPGSGDMRFQHREYIQDVLSSTSFANLSFAINPANGGCFPWLSNIAQNFQEYKFHGLVFTFVSLSAEALNSTNTALGAVIMSTDYNAGNQPYTSKQAAENSEFTVSCKPSCSLQHGIECAASRNALGGGHLYVSPLGGGLVPPLQDIKTYNMGTFQFMTAGSQAAAVIGELWVSYDIELIKPIDNSQLNRSAADHWTSLTSGAGGAASNPFGNSDAIAQVSGIGTTITSTSGGVGTITWPLNGTIPGQKYLIIWSVVDGTPQTIANAANPTLTNMALQRFWVSATAAESLQFAQGASNGVTTTVNQVLCWIVIVSNTLSVSSPAVFSITGVNYTVPYTCPMDLCIIQLPFNYV